MNFIKEDIVRAIEKIDKNPDLRKGRNSSTYDLIYNEKKYPPILVLSIASQLNNGKEILLNDFKNDIKEPFKILRNLGFEINSKEMKLKREYNLWALENLSVENTTKKQYVTNLENLTEIIGYKIFETNNIEKIEFLYYDLLKEQKIKGGKYYSENRPSASLKGWYSAAVKTYLDFLKTVQNDKAKPSIGNSLSFNQMEFIKSLNMSGLKFHNQLVNRFIASLLTKPFVLLTGLSGSGKTKIAQSFVKWICEDERQFKVIPVGADWTNREPLLGYPNGLNLEEYITSDSGALNLIIEASKIENADKPYFLILDEMNLSHVERYFADFLSVMESEDKINLYTGAKRKDLNKNYIPHEIFWTKNLFIIGTVNIDETTYMFSPKVLDRANTIEFRVDQADIKNFFDLPSKIDLSVLEGKGASMAKSFLEISRDNGIEKDDEYSGVLVKFFNELKKVGAEFGYRTAVEMLLLIKKLKIVGEVSKDESIDIAVMQKLLPKLHGSRSKISKVLDALIILCLKSGQTFSIAKSDEVLLDNIIYPIAFEKLVRMYKNALDNGFTSYAEA